MRAKALEVRDRGTFIPVLAVDMNPLPIAHLHVDYEAQLWLLRRVGYACDGYPNILITRLEGKGEATNDPFAWKDRTLTVAHEHILAHWNTLKDGDVIDVEFVLGETPEPKQSERLQHCGCPTFCGVPGCAGPG